MSEQGAAILQFMILAAICGPFYLIFLLYGYVKRKKLALQPLATWIYVASLPMALLLSVIMHFVGTIEINATSPLGNMLAYLALASVVAGLLAAFYIAIRSLRARTGQQTLPVDKHS